MSAPEPSDHERAHQPGQLLAAYINLMRWSGNFRRDEMSLHPRNRSIIMLSPLQSGLFTFSTQGSTLLLGAQPFEMTWLSLLPLESAFVCDRLYLHVSDELCEQAALPALTLGIFCDQQTKLTSMAQCNCLLRVPISVEKGVVTKIGQPVSWPPIALYDEDVVHALSCGSREGALSQRLRALL